MFDTHCIYCGSKMIWSSDFNYSEFFNPLDEEDELRTVTEMTCPECGATAMFVQPRKDD